MHIIYLYYPAFLTPPLSVLFRYAKLAARGREGDAAELFLEGI